MKHFSIKSSIETEPGLKSVDLVYANFYLNRYPVGVIETDSANLNPDPYNVTYGIEDVMPVESLSQTFKYGSGVVNLVLGDPSPVDYLNKIGTMKPTESSVPVKRVYVASEDSSYKYYATTILSTAGNPSAIDGGFGPSSGSALGVPQIEYFDAQNTNKCYPGNAVIIKWNTVGAKPVHYKVYLKSRAIDTFDAPAWNEIYDSNYDDVAFLSTGERYGVTSLTNTDGKVTRLQLSKLDTSLPSSPANPDIAGRRRAWASGDYFDFRIGSEVAILQVDNAINGVTKVINANPVEGWIEIYSDYVVSESIDDSNYAVEVYATNAGQMMLYHQSDDSWSTTPNRYSEENNNLLDICGVRVEILSVDSRSSRASMVELGAVLSADLTELVLGSDFTEALSERSSNQPIGLVSANSASIVFSNTNRTLDPSNKRRKTPSGWTGSYFAELLDDGVEIQLLKQITSLTSGNQSIVPLPPMVSDSWDFATESSSSSSVNVNVLDYSKILQDRNCPDLLLEGKSVTTIIYTLLDRIGFARVLGWPENNVSSYSEPILPWWWCRQEEKAWDAIQRLARSTQTAIFFDAYGYLRILPLCVLADVGRAQTNKNVWKLRQTEDDSGALSNIFTINRVPSIASNKVLVNYKTTSIFGEAGILARSLFWLPPDNYNMGVAQLATDINANDTQINFVTDGTAPPFARLAGYVSSGNNIIKYDATQVQLRKAYLYSIDGSAPPVRWVKNNSEYIKAKLDNDNTQPYFTGAVRIAPGQKAFLEKLIASKYCELQFFEVSYGAGNAMQVSNGLQFISESADRQSLCVNTQTRQTQNLVFGYKDYGARYESICCKLLISSGKKYNVGKRNSRAGISFFHQSKNGVQAFYVADIAVGDNDARKGKQAKVGVKRRSKDGSWITIPRIHGSEEDDGIADPPPLKRDEWHWIEVRVDTFDINKTIEMYLDGTLVGRFKDTVRTNGGSLPRNNCAGIYAKDCEAYFDKLMVLDIPSDRPDLPQSLKVYDGDVQTIKGSRITYFTKKLLTKKEKKDPGRYPKSLKYTEMDSVYSQYIQRIKNRWGAVIFVDEFNNILKEYVEETVRYDTQAGPAVTAEVANLNPNVNVDYFYTTPFGGKFHLRNNSDEAQVLSGQVMNANSDVEQTQYLSIVGNSVVQQDAQIIVKLEDLIDRVGEKVLEIDAEWVQDASSAKQLGEWIIENQGDGAEIYQLDIMINPLMEIGDQVDVLYLEKGLLPTKQRFVVESLRHNGAKTTVIIRRIYPKATEIDSSLMTWDFGDVTTP